MAGLGWQGKSLLIINPKYEPRVRYATFLTDLPLTPDEPIENKCGKCKQCIKACPVGAIKNLSFTDHPKLEKKQWTG